MFGLKIVTKKGMIEIENRARNQAIADLVDLLRKKDKIFLGDGHIIADSVFLGITGPALTVKDREEK